MILGHYVQLCVVIRNLLNRFSVRIRLKNYKDREWRHNIFCVMSPLSIFKASGTSWGCKDGQLDNINLHAGIENCDRPLLFLLGFFFPIIIFFLTVFVPPISRKRVDRFSWNFHNRYLMIKCYYTFCFDDVTSGFEKSTILWFLIGHFVQIVSPKWVKIEIWNFHGW